MNIKHTLGLLAPFLAKSKRFKPYLPFLATIPALIGAYELYRRHKSNGVAQRAHEAHAVQPTSPGWGSPTRA